MVILACTHYYFVVWLTAIFYFNTSIFNTSMFINCNFTISRSWSISSIYLFIQPFIYITMDSWILIMFHGLESVIIIHFCCSRCLDLDFENSFRLAHESFWHASITLWALPYLLVWQYILVSSLFSLPQPFNQLFLQGTLVPFIG